MLTGRKLWILTKYSCVNHIKPKVAYVYYRYIHSRARCVFGLSKKKQFTWHRERSGSVVECLTRDPGGGGGRVRASPASLRCGY